MQAPQLRAHRLMASTGVPQSCAGVQVPLSDSGIATVGNNPDAA